MSCLEASITRKECVSAILKDATKRIVAFVTHEKTLNAHCSLVCGVHNSLNILTNNAKILFDGDKLLFV